MVSDTLQQIIEGVRMGKMQSERGQLVPADLISQIRAMNDGQMAQFPLPEDMVIEASPFEGVPGEFYRFTGNDKAEGKLLLYFHGGGFENGTVASRRFIAMNIAHAAGVDCFSLDYTQWPEGHHPVALDEATAAWDVITQSYGPADIWLAGESAGTMLGLALTLKLKDQRRELPGRILSIGPVIDMAEEFPSRTEREERDPMFWSGINQSIGEHYFKGADLTDPFVSVRYGDFAGFPPTMITVGTEEVLFDDAQMLHALLDEAGVENKLRVYEGAFHTFQCMPSPEAYQSFQELAAFLQS